MLPERRISCDQFGSGDQIKRGRGQHGHVHRLADVAWGFRTACMMMEETAAPGEIQQHGARKHRQRPLRPHPSEDALTPLHDTPCLPSPLDARISPLVAKNLPYLPALLPPNNHTTLAFLITETCSLKTNTISVQPRCMNHLFGLTNSFLI